MSILAYGEDALTYWALSTGRAALLDKLEDPSLPTEVEAFYRPSFGRNAHGSELGEFDAILSTASAVYLIEAKWPASREVRWRERVVTVNDGQVLRHKKMKHYLRAWCAARPSSWAEFVAQEGADYGTAFPGSAMPAPETRLASSLSFVLARLCTRPREIVDVLLFVTTSDEAAPEAVLPSTFRLLTLLCPPFGESEFIAIDG